jgi:hypothetical protein
MDMWRVGSRHGAGEKCLVARWRDLGIVDERCGGTMRWGMCRIQDIWRTMVLLVSLLLREGIYRCFN